MTIVRVEWGFLEGRRPRVVGANSRIGVHGDIVRVPISRLTDGDGATGIGFAFADADAARGLLAGRRDVREPGGLPVPFEQALLDLAARKAAVPVHAYASGTNAPCRPRCYDTQLCFDDLGIGDHATGAALMAAEAYEGYERGHRSFKLKVGRGARHMPVEDGTVRDIAVVRAVREAIGPDCTLMLDGNDGYTLNLVTRVLLETADCDVYWIEEPFREDASLYEELRARLNAAGLGVLIADGESEILPTLTPLADAGLVDVLQYDIWAHGFGRWLETGRATKALVAPHHFGTLIGNYVACHLSPALANFDFVEWDEAAADGLDASGYEVRDGYVTVPDKPGFGLELDEAVFAKAVREGGFDVRA